MKANEIFVPQEQLFARASVGQAVAQSLAHALLLKRDDLRAIHLCDTSLLSFS